MLESERAESQPSLVFIFLLSKDLLKDHLISFKIKYCLSQPFCNESNLDTAVQLPQSHAVFPTPQSRWCTLCEKLCKWLHAGIYLCSLLSSMALKLLFRLRCTSSCISKQSISRQISSFNGLDCP